MPFQSINPTTEELIAEYSYISEGELSHKLEIAYKAFHEWRKTSFSERAKYISAVGEDLLKNKTEYGHTMTLEMGKPLKQSIAEVEKCAGCCTYYAANSEKFLSPKTYI